MYRMFITHANIIAVAFLGFCDLKKIYFEWTLLIYSLLFSFVVVVVCQISFFFVLFKDLILIAALHM